jgi:hypothetical protein
VPRTTSSGKLQVNLSIDADAYQLLSKHAHTPKGYGQFLGELLRRHDRDHEQGDLPERVRRLEACLSGELGPPAVPHEAGR